MRKNCQLKFCVLHNVGNETTSLSTCLLEFFTKFTKFAFLAFLPFLYSNMSFSPFNTEITEMAMLASTDFTEANKSYLQWGSTWWSLDQESNAYPSVLARHVLVSLRLLDPYMVMLSLIPGESCKSRKVQWCINKSQFKYRLTHTCQVSLLTLIVPALRQKLNTLTENVGFEFF